MIHHAPVRRRIYGFLPIFRPWPPPGVTPGRGRGRLAVLPAPARENSPYMALGDSAGLGGSLGVGAGVERRRGTDCGWLAGMGCR